MTVRPASPQSLPELVLALREVIIEETEHSCQPR